MAISHSPFRIFEWFQGPWLDNWLSFPTHPASHDLEFGWESYGLFTETGQIWCRRRPTTVGFTNGSTNGSCSTVGSSSSLGTFVGSQNTKAWGSNGRWKAQRSVGPIEHPLPLQDQRPLVQPLGYQRPVGLVVGRGSELRFKSSF